MTSQKAHLSTQRLSRCIVSQCGLHMTGAVKWHGTGHFDQCGKMARRWTVEGSHVPPHSLTSGILNFL